MTAPVKFEIETRSEGAEVTLSVRGELDMGTVAPLSDRVSDELEAAPERVTLDLRELQFMDSTGLRLLIELNQRSRTEGWDLRLVYPVHEAALLVLRCTGADAALPFTPAQRP
ncbi:MAG: STAS domain-containing protein [Solirubrobacteraceae bacterium]